MSQDLIEGMNALSSKHRPTDSGDQLPSTPEELLEVLRNSGGKIRVADPAPKVRSAWRRVIFALVNSGDPTIRVRHTGRDRGDLVITVQTASDLPIAPVLESIVVPETLRGCHSIIQSTKDAAKADKDGWVDTRSLPAVAHIRVHKSGLQRSLLLLQGVADEAVRRGGRVYVHKSYDCKGGFGIEIDGYGFEITVKEETRRVRYELSETEIRRYDSGYHQGWRWNFKPTGRIQLREAHYSWATPLATDRERWKIEERLPQLFLKLEREVAEKETRRLEEEHQRDLREQAREEALKLAHLRMIEHVQVKHLKAQVAACALARDIREFLRDANSLPVRTADEAIWLKWVSSYADQIDPLLAPITGPEMPDPTDENLRPFFVC